MIGKTLSHYLITNLISEGGMGGVCRAKDQVLCRAVAIKTLLGVCAKDGCRVVRGKREAYLPAAMTVQC